MSAANESIPTAETASETSIRLTPRAVETAKALLERQGLTGSGLRVGVTGGGCSGFQYALSFEPSKKDGDIVYEMDGLPVFVDPESVEVLAGVVIDYVDALHGAGFKFSNPNAARTCGCGTSFGV